MLCAHLARQLRGIVPDEAFTAGLFHDCGIPILMQYKPEYKTILARANSTPDSDFTAVEESEIGTHHAAVGYFLARSWVLSDDLCQAILWHHDVAAFSAPSVHDMVRNFIGIIQLAEHIQHLAVRNSPDIEWAKFESIVLAHFGLNEEDLVNLLDGAQDVLYED